MENTSMALLEQNIKLLEKGITLDEYAKIEMQLKVDGDTRIYNEYGFFVIHNRTQNRYLLEGGNNMSGYTMSITIPQYFLSDNGYGNPYMHKDYAAGDVLVLRFWRYNSKDYATMDQFKEYIEEYYDSIAETYYDYVMRLRDKSYDKSKRPKGYNAYYNGKEPKKIDVANVEVPHKKTLAERLLRLENKSKFLYNVLNAIFDLLIKPLPLLVFTISSNSYNIFTGSNAIQRAFSIFFGLIGAYLAAIIIYLTILLVIQLAKLFLCTYKPLVIHFRIFDIIIQLSRKKILNNNNKELIELLYRHDDVVDMRKEKGATVDLEPTREKESVTFEIMNLLSKSMQEQRKVQKEIEIQLNTISKKHAKVVHYFLLRRQREEGKRDAQRAAYDEQEARYYEEKMRAKERALGIKRED